MAVRHLTYHVIIEKEDESGLFVASVPSLPGCFSQGYSVDDAKVNIAEAIQCHVEALMELGREVPEPDNALEVAVDITVEFAA